MPDTQRQSDPMLMRAHARAHMQGMMAVAAQHGLPFVVYETGRTNTRQRWLYAYGRTRQKDKGIITNIKEDGPHGSGCAWDVVIDWNAVAWSERKGYGWQLGLSHDRKRLEDRRTFRFWWALGRVWKDGFSECIEWGGTWAKAGELIGWDPGHFEMRDWRQRGQLAGLKG